MILKNFPLDIGSRTSIATRPVRYLLHSFLSSTARVASFASGSDDFNSSPPSVVQSHCSGGADEPCSTRPFLLPGSGASGVDDFNFPPARSQCMC